MAASLQARVLVIDDGELFAEMIAERMPELELVRPEEGRLPRIEDGPAALRYLNRHAATVDVVLLDVHFDVPEDRLLPLGEGWSLRRTRRFQGIAILREIRRRFPGLPVVLLTSREDLSVVDVAADVTAGSMTYLLDSDDVDSLRIRINAALREASLGLEEAGILWGGDPRMRTLRRRLAVVARGPMPVVIEGETGTGKSFLAERFIHINSGRPGPFVTLDLSTVPADLVPATLFGAVRGAYTGSVADRKGVFELAHGGTLFIDEIQNAPLEVQRQLLLALQARRVRPLGASTEIDVDVKVVAASSSPLAEAVADGRFRADLYMRLSPPTRVALPPLRDRPDDLEFLARRFLSAAVEAPGVSDLRSELATALELPRQCEVRLAVGRERSSRAAPSHAIELTLASPSWKRLQSHPWPGNMRELAMVMHNVVTFTLAAAVDALRAGTTLKSHRFQVDPGLVAELLAGAAGLRQSEGGLTPAADTLESFRVRIRPGESLNGVAKAVERQYFLSLFRQTGGDFDAMADVLLGDASRGRAIRLRFNQLDLKVRELRR